jgi:hypothetical protein
VFLLSPKSCANQWSNSGDHELDLGELSRECCSSRELRSHHLTGASLRFDRCRLLLSFARVNIWVSSLLSRVAVVSRLGQFGAL